MRNKLLAVLLLFVLLTSNFNIGFAINNPTDEINADSVFDSITILLSSNKSAAFSAYTNDTVGYIEVASCWLQKKVDNNWVYVSSLPRPTEIEYNTFGYESIKDYSSYIPSDGNTYRVAARFVADGHHATRYSNQRSF